MGTTFTNQVTVLSKSSYEEWKDLLEECGIRHTIVNESDYSGFQVKFMWNE